MMRWRSVFRFTAVMAGVAWVSMAQEEGGGSTLILSPTSLTFNATAGGGAPPSQTLSVRASSRTEFTARASARSGGEDQRESANWLSISPSGTLYTNQDLTVSVNPARLAAGAYNGTISLRTARGRQTVAVRLTVAQAVVSPAGGTLTLAPPSLNFFGTLNSAAPAPQTLSVTAGSATNFTASASVQSGGTNWLSVSPSGALTTNQNLTVTVSLAGLLAGTYKGSISIVANGSTRSAPVTFVVNTASTAGGGGTSFKLIGWNDLGMHCDDGQDYSVFGVLPPYNTIHAHLIDSAGKLVVAPAGYTITYQAITDPLTNTINTTSSIKTNFWKFVSYLFPALFPTPGLLADDVGIAGSPMPGAGNTPRAMNWNTSPADNTWVAVGIPMTNYADGPSAPYTKNYFPMMRLVAKNTSGTVLATTDIVLPISDEMSCNLCHASNTSGAAMPAAGWVNNSDPAKDVKLNILRKHDDRFLGNAAFIAASSTRGYSPAGLEAQSAIHPFLCASCHGSNALSMASLPNVPPLTTSMHGMHATVIDPGTGASLESATTRESCYHCHPGPVTQCLRGAMSNVATANSGQIAYTSVFTTGTAVRVAADPTFATNANTPAAGLSLYRFSSGHGGLQCEACHGSTHAEFPTSIVNDNVQSTTLQGHVGVLVECASCHGTVPNTTNGGPHGLHPVGSSWVSAHQDVADGHQATCQPCHGTDYRGTILSKTQADRTLAGHSFPRGTIIGCYSCHNGPNGG